MLLSQINCLINVQRFNNTIFFFIVIFINPIHTKKCVCLYVGFISFWGIVKWEQFSTVRIQYSSLIDKNLLADADTDVPQNKSLLCLQVGLNPGQADAWPVCLTLQWKAWQLWIHLPPLLLFPLTYSCVQWVPVWSRGPADVTPESWNIHSDNKQSHNGPEEEEETWRWRGTAMHHILFFQEVEKKNNTVEIPFRIKAARKQKSHRLSPETTTLKHMFAWIYRVFNRILVKRINFTNYTKEPWKTTTTSVCWAFLQQHYTFLPVPLHHCFHFSCDYSYKLEKPKSESDLIIFYWNHPPEGIKMFCSPISLCMAVTLDGITAPPDFTTSQ